MTDPARRAAADPPEPAPGDPTAGEVCELCAEPISDEHGHLVDLQARNLMCACRGCYLLFVSEGAGGAHFRSVPDRYLAFTDFALSPEQWDNLQIPVSVAFFFLNSSLGQSGGLLPGAGRRHRVRAPARHLGRGHRGQPPTRERCSPTSRRSWSAARPEQGGAECYIVPIDACYELVGHLRTLWRGFDGGKEANAKLDAFFDDVRARAR